MNSIPPPELFRAKLKRMLCFFWSLSLNRNPLRHNEEGKMQSGAHQRSTLGNLAAEVGQIMLHSSQKNKLRSASGWGTNRSNMFECFYGQDADNCCFHLSSCHGGGSVK